VLFLFWVAGFQLNYMYLWVVILMSIVG
jgi:hypothetical protein